MGFRWYGGGKISRKMQIVLVLAVCIAFLNSNVIYAESLDQAPENISNSSEMDITDLNSTENNTTSLNETTPTTVNTSTSGDAADAAGDTTTPHGSMWVKAWDMDDVNFTQIKEAGITDVFLEQQAFEKTQFQTSLNDFLDRAQKAGVRVNAWVICFKDSNGDWVDPTGKYSYTATTSYTEAVKVAYKYWYKTKVKVYYTKYVKSYYKSWYKYNGKWRYKWKYKWVKKTYYKYTYKWKYTWKYKTTYVTKTKTTTTYAYNSTYINSYINNLTARIVKYTNMDGVGGIHLDYLRYPGTAYKYTNGTQAITQFVATVSSTVKNINPNALLSAALMPETSSNAYYYGQDYTQLGKYLDVLIPMIYEGNYNKDNSWIASTTSYIASHSSGAQVWAGLQTYKSDEDTTPLSVTALLADVQSALDNGATGYALFRYGNVLNDEFFNYASTLKINAKETSPTVPPSSENSINIDLSSIKDAAQRVKAFVDTNHRLPNYVTMNNEQVSMSQFLYLLVKGISQLNSGITSSITLKTVSNPANSSGSSVNGLVYKNEYVNIAGNVLNYINSYGRAPNYASTSLGNIQYETVIYMMSKIMDFHKTNGRLPNYVSVNTVLGNINSPYNGESLSAYLQATANCQVNDPNIKALAASLTSGLTSDWEKASKVFNWVRDNLNYSFYYNTKYGAAKTLQNKVGNCVDHTHLVVALSRAAGIEARYVHGTCKFNSGNTYGHVWAQLLVDGVWYAADATSYSNSLGKITNWDTSSYTLKSVYAELPF